MSETLFTIVLIGVVTFALRFCFFGPLNTDFLPRDVERALPYIMPAALMAIIVPDVILAEPSDASSSLWLTPYFVGAAVGFGVGVFKRERFWFIVVAALVAFVASSYFLRGAM